MYHPEGVYPAMPTPFRRNGDLDIALLRELIACFEGTGVNGLLVMGTAGEFAMMSDAERRQVIEAVVGSARKLEIIVNAGLASTRETIALAKYAVDAGADAVIAVGPYFYHPTQEGMARHYLSIAEAVDGPVIAYNIPAFSGNRISPGVMAHFAKDARIVGIKDSEGDMATLADFIFRAQEGFSVMVGADSLVSAGIALGAKGVMVGSASIVPRLCVEIYRALRSGKYGRAFELQRSLDHVVRAMQVGTFPAAIKHAMTCVGHPAGYVRTPLQELTGVEKKEVEMHLRNAKIVQELYL